MTTDIRHPARLRIGGMQTSRDLVFRSLRPKDSWLAPFAKEACAVDVVAVAVLMLAAGLCLVRSVPDARSGSTPAGTAT